ncbi:MAG TPA: ATP-binding protein, partial [Candidatus Paceibacterota bacterium]|nr:ATP-binding protein [Candidatus Paceibacterota bacterium]
RPPFRLRDGGFQLPPRLAALFEESETNGFYYVIWGRDGRKLAHSTNAPSVEFVVPIPRRGENGEQPDRADQPPLQRGPGPRRSEPGRTRGSFRELRVMSRGEVILVGRSIQPEITDLHRTAWELAGVGGLILLVGLAGGWWLATRAIRPIEEISGTALKIAAGDLSQRMNIAETKSELGQLASVLNSTFARLESAFAQQQQFASDAAHELRTPVTVMLTQTQTSLNRERSAAEYRDAVEVCQRSAQRMRRLIESLLELARLDAGQETMKRNRFDVARLAADCLELIRPLATEQKIALRTELSAVECVGDSERIGQVITNLLTNAVHHNKEAGEVCVVTRREGEFVLIEVTDNGPGIAPEHLPKIFQRFYRVDSARTAAQGRSGLGLAISKAIVEAHGGSIEVSSEFGKGTTFRVRLPVG